MALFGFNLGAQANAALQNGRLPTTLGSTTVTFDGFPAPLIYASPTQIKAIVPYEIAGHNATKMTVQAAGGAYSTAVPVAQAVPALFTANTTGATSPLHRHRQINTHSSSDRAKGDISTLPRHDIFWPCGARIL